LFLDEIGELPVAAQAKLLRVLEQREVTRLGANRPLSVAVRVVAATNRDLDRMVADGGFREDLLYRLNVHVVTVPPLRDRPEDIAFLAERFLDQVCRRFGVLPKRLAGEARERLAGYDWRRNNVRELRNVIERAVVLADGDVIRVEHLPPNLGAAAPDPTGDDMSFQAQRTRAERQIVLAALERHDWHVTRTAESLGLADHASLLKIMRRLDIRRG
ncbi:MAG: sigma 54-interacting transcriptional regulator, partial [Gemmatimonadales bacterium]|nr:sigma 54-interacting transcriptional regulator [Gemmatimonadales bacterium]